VVNVADDLEHMDFTSALIYTAKAHSTGGRSLIQADANKQRARMGDKSG